MASLLMARPDLADLPAYSATVRAATAADDVALARLLDASFDESWDAARVHRDLLDDPTVVRTLLVEDGGRVIATASARVMPVEYPGMGYLHWVASDPARRGEGLGLAVTIAVLEAFAELGLSGSVLETDDHRHSAIRVYLGLGYTPVYRDDEHRPRWSKIFRALAVRRPAPAAP